MNIQNCISDALRQQIVLLPGVVLSMNSLAKHKNGAFHRGANQQIIEFCNFSKENKPSIAFWENQFSYWRTMS